MQSCLYAGWVRHRRNAPVPHAFRYRLCLLYLDLAEVPQALEGRWFWSARRLALARWHREVNGAQRSYFCGAYWRSGFHEDGVVSAQAALAHFDEDLARAELPLRRVG